MFVRTKKSGKREYLQIVKNERLGDKVQQRVLLTLGRMDILQANGQLDSLLRSGLRFSTRLRVLDAHQSDKTTKTNTLHIGPALLFEKLWEELGIKEVLQSRVAARRFQFSIERAIFLTVLHRLFSPGSDRAAEKWKENYAISGIGKLDLQHLYRTMGWLGEWLPEAEEQEDSNPFVMRCTKDLLEEDLFLRQRDLFTDLSLVFFDTTSLYFEGQGGLTLGEYGHSKDHRPGLRQIVVGVVLDNAGNPVCSEILPGNTSDIKTLIPVAERLKKRFGIEKVCMVADRGMISKKTIAELEELSWDYILGVRMRKVKEVREKVLADIGRFKVINPKRTYSKDPSPLKVKEVDIDGTRYIVCHNEEQAVKDRRDRENIIESLREHLKAGDKSLVGNKGYRKYIKCETRNFGIDENKVEEEKIYDGKWVLTTSTDLPTEEVALKYKQLLTVEDIFRTMKSTLETRPIYHKCDETITGHVFCSFLALKLRKRLQDLIDDKGWKLEWADIVHDVNEITEVKITHNKEKFIFDLAPKKWTLSLDTICYTRPFL